MESMVGEGEGAGQAGQRRPKRGREWVSIVGLLAVFGLWSHLTPYDALVRFMLTMGSIVVIFEAIHEGQYGFAVVFGALALLYNPIAPVFSFSGGWQRALVLASTAPLLASLARPSFKDGI